MDQTPKTGALDSTMLVQMTVGELRDLIRAEIQAATTAKQEADRLLDVKETAKRFSLSEDWLYRHAKELPFTRKVGRKMLRFSEQGLVKWLVTRKPLRNGC